MLNVVGCYVATCVSSENVLAFDNSGHILQSARELKLIIPSILAKRYTLRF